MESIDYLRRRLLKGLVIPAHPLALKKDRTFDEASQARLSRYYLDSGAGGLAVGVHTTQFAIHDPKIGLLEPVWRLAGETVRSRGDSETILVAGVCGDTQQAVGEAALATSIGYDTGLLSLSAMKEAAESTLLDHCRCVSEAIPLFGFYLQPAVGGRVLSYRFWRAFCELPNVVAIKVAPFNRYQTLDVVRALHDSSRANEIALYTGNDDAIVMDLCSEYFIDGSMLDSPIRFRGGLLGHWACWTKSAVDLHRRCQQVFSLPAMEREEELRELLGLSHQVTDMNAAIFDAANQFHGCIAGIHEVLYRQGLMTSNLCLDERESLSPGQSAEIDRVQSLYPHLLDDAFVKEWMAADKD